MLRLQALTCNACVVSARAASSYIIQLFYVIFLHIYFIIILLCFSHFLQSTIVCARGLFNVIRLLWIVHFTVSHSVHFGFVRSISFIFFYFLFNLSALYLVCLFFCFSFSFSLASFFSTMHSTCCFFVLLWDFSKIVFRYLDSLSLFYSFIDCTVLDILSVLPFYFHLILTMLCYFHKTVFCMYLCVSLCIFTFWICSIAF